MFKKTKRNLKLIKLLKDIRTIINENYNLKLTRY